MVEAAKQTYARARTSARQSVRRTRPQGFDRAEPRRGGARWPEDVSLRGRSGAAHPARYSGPQRRPARQIASPKAGGYARTSRSTSCRLAPVDRIAHFPHRGGASLDVELRVTESMDVKRLTEV